MIASGEYQKLCVTSHWKKNIDLVILEVYEPKVPQWTFKDGTFVVWSRE